MEGISSGNSQRILRFSRPVFLAAWIVMCLAHSQASSQCHVSPDAWVERLGQIEQSDAGLAGKITQLASLTASYDECILAPDSIHAQMLHRLGDYYRLNGDFEKAFRLTSEAISINKRSDPRASKAYLTHSYYNLGLYNVILGMTRNAHLYFDSCVYIGSQFPAKVFIALMALEKKAFMYFQTGDYEQSIVTADHGINLARINDLFDYEALLLIQRAQSEAELDRIHQAENDIARALSILAQYKLDFWLPNAWSVYANVLGRKKAFAEAIAYYNKAFEANLAQQNPVQAARDLNDLALLYDRGMNDPENAITHYSRAVSILEQQGDRYLLATTYSNLGLVSWRSNDFKSALTYYQRGLNSLPIGFDDSSHAANPSVSALQSATNAYIPAALLYNKGDAWLGLYSLQKDEALLEHALDAYRVGDRMVDEMRWKQQGEQSKLFWREKTKRWYGRAVEASFLLKDPARAFYFMEKSRAVLLNDRLAELGAKNQLPPEEAETEKRLRIRLQSVEANLSSSAGMSEGDAFWNARNDLNNFIRRLEKIYPSYYAYKYDTTVSTLADLQSSLAGTDQAWIELFTNDSTIYALTVTSDETQLEKIAFPNHAKIAKSITDLCSASGSINTYFRQYHAVSRLYYNTVFKPLNISAKRITVSQDEYFIPFDLLQTDSAKDTGFLLRDHAFSYAYSASHFLRDRARKAPGERSLLAMAPVKYATSLQLQDLQGADLSLEKIGSYYQDGVFLTGNTATRTAFLRQLPDFDMIHLYSHAKADTLGNEPVIYFYDTALNLSELQNLPGLRTRLMVLFACNTGVGKSIKGEGILSMARGFASAGIPSTVSALWEIDNKTTYALAELFFSNMAKGQPSDVALQQAKLEIIDNSDREHELPYFWAGTVLIGRPQIFVPGNSSVFSVYVIYILLAGIVLILSGLAFIAAMRRSGNRKAGAV